ncbi:MAG TPA: PaaI family thioesterase [Acidimicrobiales bacterium]|nr:PaaI family thioesterase [Acidimicrobiales bacterium]
MSRDERIQVPPNCDLTLGVTCTDKSTPGRTTWQMRADERFANPAGILQGGFITALADAAMGAATITALGDAKVFSSNVELKTSFMRPARVGTTLTGTGWVVNKGRRVVFCEAEITDGNGKLIARASSTYVLTPRGDDDGGGSAPLVG